MNATAPAPVVSRPTSRLTTAASAEITRSTVAARRTERRAWDTRSTIQTVAIWTVITSEAAHDAATATENTYVKRIISRTEP